MARSTTATVAVAAAIATAVAVVLARAAAGQLFGIDGATRAMTALALARDAQAGRWHELWTTIHQQTTWPPLLQLATAGLFLLAGPSELAASLPSLASLVVLSALLAYVATRTAGIAAGIAVAVMFLAAPQSCAAALGVDLEHPVTVLCVLALISWTAARAGQRRGLYLLTGLLAAAAFLTKYNYGGFLLATLVGGGALAGRPWRRSLLYLFVPAGLLVALWLAFPLDAKLEGLAGFAVNRSSGVALWSREALVTYPKAFVREYATNLAASAVIAALFLAGLPRALRTPELRPFLLFSAIGGVALFLHPYKSGRFIGPLMPGVWLVAAVALTAYLKRPALAVAAAVLGLWAMVTTVGAQTREMGSPHHTVVALADATILSHAHDSPLLVVGDYAALSTSLLRWQLRDRVAEVVGVVDLVSYADPAEVKAEKLRRWIGERRPPVVALIAIPDTSPLYDFDYHRYNAWKRELLPIAAAEPNYRRLAGFEDPTGALRVDVLARVGP